MESTNVKEKALNLFKGSEQESYDVTNLPDGMFLSPFSFEEFALRDYEGWLSGLLLRNVAKIMLRDNLGKGAAIMSQENVNSRNVSLAIIVIVILLIIYIFSQALYAKLVEDMDETTKLILGATVGLLSGVLIYFAGIFNWFLITFVAPKETKQELRREYIEANLDALVPESGDLPPDFIEALRQNTPAYSSGAKTQEMIFQLDTREKKSRNLGPKRKFPHHLEFIFNHEEFQVDDYQNYPLMDGSRKTVQTDSANQGWTWIMVGIWSLLPPSPESQSNWGTSRDNQARIAAYRVFAKSVLAHSVFDAICSHDFDHSRIPPSRLKRMIDAFGISSGDDETPRFDSSKVDEFITQMSQGDANEDLPTILEIMAEDLSSKS